jgi:hypothetical protein
MLPPWAYLRYIKNSSYNHVVEMLPIVGKNHVLCRIYTFLMTKQKIHSKNKLEQEEILKGFPA